MNILFLSRWFPFPPDNGSKLRIYHLLNGLSRVHNITLLSFVEPPSILMDCVEANKICSEVQVVPWKPFDKKSLSSQWGFLSSQPRFLLDTHSSQMEKLIREALTKKSYDLVIASQLSMAAYYPLFRNLPALFEEIELGVFYDQAYHSRNPIARLRNSLTWFKLRQYLSHFLVFFQACTVASEQEYRLFTNSFPSHRDKIRIMPNCINLEDYQGLNVKAQPNRLVFSGSFRYSANYHAMQWFVGEVFPRVLEQVPQAQLLITGDHDDMPLPSTKNIIRTGRVDDIKSVIASSWISLAPLLVGGGTRLKILEAMALGVPVVATSKGAEGLNAWEDEHLLIADEPEKFAQAVIRLLKDHELHDQVSVNATHFVKAKYDWAAWMPAMMDLMDQVAAQRG
jgi:polysaccharide biosynthesis protein PslH